MEQRLAILTRTRLAQAIEQRSGPWWSCRQALFVWRIIRRARAGAYDEYGDASATPILNLVNDLRALGFTDLAQRALEGEFDASEAEVAAWMQRGD